MLTIISGTNRPDSNTRKVSSAIAGIYESLDTPHQVLDLAELPPEIFHPKSYAEKPAAFKKFSDAVLGASGLVVVTPEYNGGIPGVLKYFIDMLEFPESFEARPVCFVGIAAGMWGALRPVEQLQQVFGYRNAHIFPERVFIPGIFKLIGEDGQLNDEKIGERLRKQAEGYLAFVEALQPLR
jgi:chromate reductase, NAD(P)H dehydrogenase (quinone)